MRISSANGNFVYGQNAVCVIEWEKKQKINYDEFPVDFFTRIEFDLILETGDKWILVFKRIFVRV